MGMIKLPDDLKEFLAANRQLEYSAADCECGQVILLPLGEHELGEVWVDGQSLYDIAPDPNKDIEGYYAVPAVNLVESCDGYDPEHILSWIPDSNLYISWDCDHWAITMFPEVTWREIAASPLQYINAQWESPSIGQTLIPWPQFPFKQGCPF